MGLSAILLTLLAGNWSPTATVRNKTVCTWLLHLAYLPNRTASLFVPVHRHITMELVENSRCYAVDSELFWLWHDWFQCM